MSESYRTVTAKVRQIRTNSIMVEVPNRPGWQSIPRSLIHGGDEYKLDRFIHSPDGTEELGLAG